MTKMEIDRYDQAIKALTQRCPFDTTEELASHVPFLPFRLARKYSKNHSKLKKPPGESQTVDATAATAAAKQGKSSGIWEQAEVYFRAIIESDIEFLRHRRLDETLFSIPSLKDSNFNEVFDADSATSIITTDALSVKEEVTEEVLKNGSINWLLGSKHRAILASERPNKKRKLLGSDAGLDQLLALNDSKESKVVCDVCCLGESGVNSDDIVTCTLCNVLVHKKCYGLHEKIANGSFLCSWCNHLDTKTSLKPCLLCPKEGGALKIVSGDGRINGKFVHLFCSIWTPEVFVEDLDKMEPVLNVGGVEEKRMSMVCTLCKIKHGACVRCSYGSCRAAFHPICARDARHRMEIWGKFGCDNVELRVFCSKHSTADDAQSTIENIPLAKPNNIIKLKLSSNNKGREKQSEEKILVPSKLIENEVTLEEDALVINPTITLDVDALVINPTKENDDVFSCKHICTEAIESDNTSLDISNLILLVKKLIGRGKIVVSDAAAEIGISSDTLEAVLSGNISSFSPELRVKFTKWVQKLTHTCITMQQTKIRKGYSISSLTDATNSGFSGSFRLDSANDTNDFVKLLPIKMEDDKMICSFEEKEQKDSKKELLNESSEVTDLHLNDTKQNTVNGCISPLHDQPENQTSLEMVTEGSCVTQTLCPQAVEGSYLTVEKDLLKAEQIQCTVEVVPPKNLNKNHTLEASTLDISLKNERIDGSSTASYVHPYIQTRLMQTQGLPTEPESLKCQIEAEVLPTKSSGISEQLLSSFDLDQLANAKKLGILECSPEDELEGEIVYQQKKLLDNAFTIKHGFEDLFGKVMKKLPQEIYDLKKREWDLVTVNQFLCEDNDTKKRGRKGRKRREVPPEVETDPAMPSTSSGPLGTKDEDGVSPNTENPQILLPSRSTRGLRLRDTERTSISKPSHSKSADENLVLCDICSRPETLLNRMFICSVCKVAVHLDCYCKLTDPIGLWKCNVCENSLESGTPQSTVECVLCGGGKGAFRESTEGQWVHAFCAEWLLEATYRRGQQNLVEGVEEVSKGKNTHTCNVCKRNNGVCLMCNYEHCQATFHPTCARAAGYFMDVKIVGGSFHHKSYCDKHSMQQRQKAEDQQYSDEEFKSIKQMRFELEKLRILCERIVRREKIKKELVICSHAVFASKKDCLAFTMPVRKLIRRPICMSSASSESATTSIDNKSYSGTGTVQRSEDVITVRSTVSSKSRSRISFETDGKNDETSTSKPLSKRKMVDKSSCSGKQLPHRIKVLSFQCTGDGGKKLNAIKASAHNKLEKGFVYVPISPLSEVKPIIHGSPSHESEEPGG